MLQDKNGRWLMGFSLNIGYCTSVMAELWAVFKGLEQVWHLGYKHVVLDVDSKEVNDLLLSHFSSQWRYGLLLAKCLCLLQMNWDIRVQHVYREGNRVADCLANNFFVPWFVLMEYSSIRD